MVRGGGNVQGWNDGSEDYNKIYDLRKEVEKLKEEKAKLAEALKHAITLLHEDVKCSKKIVDLDLSAGSTYTLELRPWVREALEMIGEDPEKYY